MAAGQVHVETVPSGGTGHIMLELARDRCGSPRSGRARRCEPPAQRDGELLRSAAGNCPSQAVMAPGGPARLGTVSIRAMRDVQDDDGASILIDPVANTPVRPAAGRRLPGILIPQQMADAVRVPRQRASEEPGRGRGDLLGQPRELTLRTRPDVQVPAAGPPGHAAPASRNR